MPDRIFCATPEIEIVVDALLARYASAGYSKHLGYLDRGLIRRTGKHPADITSEDIEKILITTTSQKTKALYYARFKSIFRSLQEMGLVPEDHNPLKKLARIKSPRGLPRPFTPNEVALILENAPQPMLDMMVFSCFAGMRAMEISQIRGVDLEDTMDGLYLRIPNGKGRTDLSLPAHPKIVEIFSRRNTPGRFWPYRANRISIMCCRVLKDLGINKSLHSGRHYFATTAYAASGGDLLAVSKLMRHSSVATTQVYAQLGSGVARNVINNLSEPKLPIR